ncbi:uncharacterized protein LOC117531994 [Thalassophryne amazonica]|uniref:uncharacterized protein LOC117531994 n=1 Tax=Thalassophryne amazonica TaxID=390379 RepID=UPI001470EFAD|nr:uncharacterized protein LOC117531994 [Thalassophryne amazonica]
MGVLQLFLCLVILGHFIVVPALNEEQNNLFSSDFPGFWDNVLGFPIRRSFDFSNDGVFSTWRTQVPDGSMLATLPLYVNVPTVQVSCDEFRLNVLVSKRLGAVTLREEELQLGNGCSSNKQFPNHFVFTYNLDQCGTTLVVQKGLEVYVNSLHFSPRRPVNSWWPTPFMVHISCMPMRCFSVTQPCMCLKVNAKGGGVLSHQV